MSQFTTPEAFLFDNILQQQGGFPTISPSDTSKYHLDMSMLRDMLPLSPSSEDGSKSPSNSADTNLVSTKRKYHNKSRNGCATCKKRRVKCDERHPICSKCEHMKIECVYLPVEKKIRRKKKEILEERARQREALDKLFLEQGDEHSKLLLLMLQLQLQLLLMTTPRDGHSHQYSLDSHLSPDQEPHHRANNHHHLIPSISVDDYDSHSLNYTATSISERDNSLLSLLSSQSSPLSTNGVIKQELPIDLSASTIHPHFAQNTLPVSDPSRQGQNSHFHNKSSLSHSSNLLTVLSVLLLLLSLMPQPQQNQQPQQQSPVTPQQIQEKIQRAQEAQKERVKQFQEYATKTEPSLTPSVTSPITSGPLNSYNYPGALNVLDLRLMYHYTTKVWPTITLAGISEERIWSEDIPMLAFNYPFLMHLILAFSATHLSRTERGLDQCVTFHRGDALRLLRELVLQISPENTDALVASLLILIMDSLANASLPTSTSPKSLPASAWIFHVKGAATILTAVWPLNESSRFYKLIGVELGDLGDIANDKKASDLNPANMASSINEQPSFSNLQCFDSEIADLYPVPFNSPYLITLAYLNKLHSERYKSDFILRIFAFPALLDKNFLGLLITGDISAMRIMRSYYTLLRSFTTEMKDKVWFLEGVSKVLPVDVEQYSGGGGMNMMLDFLGGPATLDVEEDEDLDSYSEVGNGLLNPDNLPSSITNNLDVMQGDHEFI